MCTAAMNKLSAQRRYLDPVFASVLKTSNITFDTNRSVNLLYGQPIPGYGTQPLFTDNLLMDVYQPAGDTNSSRPVVILVHTGSYLPAIMNQQVSGSKNDSNIVEICTRFAKMGYVAVAMENRMGWNPQTQVQQDAAEQLIKATYRGIQDVRNCIRFLRYNQSTYKIDTSKIIVGGQGTGGYIAMGVGTVDKRTEIESNPKFLRSNFTPMVNVDTLGDWLGRGGNPYFNYTGDSTISGNAHMIFNFGGAMGDSAWLDNKSLPMVSLHCTTDPFAPFNIGNVIVPTTGITVISNATGAKINIPKANALGINNKINSRNYTDPISLRAMQASSGVKNMFPFYTLYPGEASPWEWWDRPTVQAITSVTYRGIPLPQNGRNADSLSMLTDPNMSAPKARAYIDTIIGFVAPRIATQFDLWPPDTLSVFGLTSPNNNFTATVYNSANRDTVSWQPSIGGYPALGAVTYTWMLTAAAGNFATPVFSRSATTNSAIFFDSVIYNVLAANGIAQNQTFVGKWTVKAMVGTSVKWAKDTFNISLTRGSNVGFNEVNMKTAVSVYPNPAKSIINISASQHVVISSVQIIDITGRTLISENNLNTNAYSIENHNLKNGIYFVTVNAKDGSSVTRKIVIE